MVCGGVTSENFSFSTNYAHYTRKKGRDVIVVGLSYLVQSSSDGRSDDQSESEERLEGSLERNTIEIKPLNNF